MLRDGRLHIPPAGKVVITFRGQGSAGSFVGFESEFFFTIAAAAAINGQKAAEIIAEIFCQVWAGGEVDGATICVNIGKWCAERILVRVALL